MYSPIGESTETSNGHNAKETPKSTMMRAVKLQQTYAELKSDLLEEINTVDARIIRPAMDAKDHIQPLKKVMKKRGDKKARKAPAFLYEQAKADSSRWSLRNTSPVSTKGGRT